MLEPEPVASTSDSESEQGSESDGASSSEESEAGGEAVGADAAAAQEALANGGAAGAEELIDPAEQVGAAAAAGGMPSAGGMPVAGGVPGSEEFGLDQELMESLQVFDGEMQRTITILASAGAPTDLEGDRGTDGGAEQTNQNLDQSGDGPGLVLVNGDPSLLPKAGSAEPGGGPLQSGILVSGDVEGATRAGSGQQGDDVTLMVVDRVPPDVGDGADDDVVARQIREAAMNEADPVLREKLWEEYRNYRKSAG